MEGIFGMSTSMSGVFSSFLTCWNVVVPLTTVSFAPSLSFQLDLIFFSFDQCHHPTPGFGFRLIDDVSYQIKGRAEQRIGGEG